MIRPCSRCRYGQLYAELQVDGEHEMKCLNCGFIIYPANPAPLKMGHEPGHDRKKPVSAANKAHRPTPGQRKSHQGVMVSPHSSHISGRPRD